MINEKDLISCNWNLKKNCEAQARVRQGSGKDRQGMVPKAKGLKA